MENIFPDITEINLSCFKVICQALPSKLVSKYQSTWLRRVRMASQSTSYRDRAAICAWCAEQTISAEAAASLLYLQQQWLLVAAVAEIIEGNNLRASLSSDLHHLSPQ
jgi:hypothetical protein